MIIQRKFSICKYLIWYNIIYKNHILYLWKKYSILSFTKKYFNSIKKIVSKFERNYFKLINFNSYSEIIIVEWLFSQLQKLLKKLYCITWFKAQV